MYTKSFEDVLFPPGTRVEFPLDFGVQGVQCSLILCNYDREPELYTLGTTGYVMVPTFDLGASEDTADEAVAAVVKKIKDCALKVLKAAANMTTGILYCKDKVAFENMANKYWYTKNSPHPIKAYAFEYAPGEWIVSDQEKAGLYIVVRTEMFVGRNYIHAKDTSCYAYGEFGFVCLDTRYVAFGRTN